MSARYMFYTTNSVAVVVVLVKYWNPCLTRFYLQRETLCKGKGVTLALAAEQHSKILNLLQFLLPQSLKSQEKFAPTHFVRKRIFTVELLIFSLIHLVSNQNGCGYKHNLQILWRTLREQNLTSVDDYGPSAAAFCKARKKLPAQVIKNIFRRVADFSDQLKPSFRWKGRRLFAIDGMRLHLPASAELRQHFKCPENQHGKSHYPQGLMSVLFNVLTDVVHNYVLAPYDSHERELALQHFDYLLPGDIVIVDCGYHSFEMIWEFIKRRLDFVMRLPIDRTWNVVEEFIRSGKREAIVALPMSQPARKRFRHDPSVPKILPVRLLRIELSTGEFEILATSLLNRSKFPFADFQGLYQSRWPIEESNKSIKHHQFIEHFHAEDVNGIMQEVNAHYLLMGITRMLMIQAEAQNPERMYGLSYKAAVDFTSDELVSLFLNKEPTRLNKTVRQITAMISRVYEKPRMNRSFPRQRRSRASTSYPVVPARC